MNLAVELRVNQNDLPLSPLQPLPRSLFHSSTSSDDPSITGKHGATTSTMIRIPDMQFSSQPMPMLRGQNKKAQGSRREEDEEGFKENTMRCPKSVSSKVKGRCTLHRRRDRGPQSPQSPQSPHGSGVSAINEPVPDCDSDDGVGWTLEMEMEPGSNADVAALPGAPCRDKGAGKASSI